ncbi:fluoride efflux transporter CrcB [Maritimibacter sp. UBA3975]|uniref:fluoride efflux transporter CrcB n=1 Tax=Maritimibacter sp. UBA3975 TaxID=1946833 RepID=UPI000C0AF3C8|nr:fluoride efflux transporter CrcB [Maritimibacter sp. UBA3975]MAM63817.1 fluoride efflux transporter CrcB [Maritimibacter sp.]|tara:strand:- start:119357 stop:119734 length:378 start_codon:yes stop_codon:yes gene_type:complete
MFGTVLSVALGGALGASGRYLVNVGATRAFGHGYPAGTLIVNVVGSFLMGVLFVVLAKKGGNAYAPFLMTGVLGGFTTFSAFSLDTLTLFERGQVASAAGYVALSVALSLGALVVGAYAARAVFA